ncbi:MAG: hypothetical protein MK290_05000 [Pedosphaera sp.]|nr:hypothetical protein [Pedosphaera sp.]
MSFPGQASNLRGGMKGRSLTFLVALLAGAALGQAASQVPLSIETLAAKADAVVHGRVVRMSCQRDDEGRIFTKVHLQIIEQVKGRERGAALVIVQGGGVLGRRIARSPIQPKYKVGTEVVVFAVFNSRGEAVTLGLNQGKFDVVRQPEIGLATVRNPFHGLAKRDDPRAVVKRALGQAKSLTLAELMRRVRRAMK